MVFFIKKVHKVLCWKNLLLSLRIHLTVNFHNKKRYRYRKASISLYIWCTKCLFICRTVPSPFDCDIIGFFRDCFLHVLLNLQFQSAIQKTCLNIFLLHIFPYIETPAASTSIAFPPDVYSVANSASLNKDSWPSICLVVFS